MVRKRKKNVAPAPSLSVGWSESDQDIIDFLDSTTSATGLSKTTLVKNALRVYAQRVKEDGKITVLLPENLFDKSSVSDEDNSSAVRDEIEDNIATQKRTVQNTTSEDKEDSNSSKDDGYVDITSENMSDMMKPLIDYK